MRQLIHDFILQPAQRAPQARALAQRPTEMPSPALAQLPAETQ